MASKLVNKDTGEVVQRVKGFSNNGVKWKGQDNFDQSYESIKIVDKVVKTGTGDDDYIVKKVVIREYTPIQEVIDADKESVGVYNIIKQVTRTGDTSLLPIDKGNCNVDLVGAPETLMEVKQMGEKAAKDFAALPNDLTRGQSMVDFVNNMTQEQFDAFIKAVADRSSGKVENTNE